MSKRSTSRGMVTRIDAKVYYNSNGEMVTVFYNPSEMYVLNNTLGDVQIYDPSKNTVIKSLDNRLSSQNTTFYNFLLGNIGDLGLVQAGFKMKESSVEDMMLVSKWDPPVDAKKQMSYAELVSNGAHPIFMGYLNKNDEYIKKIYYYDFQMVAGREFPKSITEIDYNNGDSVITKTSFTSFDFDLSSDQEMVNFKVPSNAKLLE